ncbi:MAG TPA: DUF4148 domain-containing protein [Paraburkholderia sp.]|nr:DUF4148 domain-containing protein [Paraburkholderia sp.]
MKFVQSLIVAAVVAVPTLSFAQSSQPLTRAQVRAELVQLEQAGYKPWGDSTTYPQNIQAAEANVNAQNHDAESTYGVSTSGSSAAGAPVASGSLQRNVPGVGSIDTHH